MASLSVILHEVALLMAKSIDTVRQNSACKLICLRNIFKRSSHDIFLLHSRSSWEGGAIFPAGWRDSGRNAFPCSTTLSLIQNLSQGKRLWRPKYSTSEIIEFEFISLAVKNGCSYIQMLNHRPLLSFLVNFQTRYRHQNNWRFAMTREAG